MLCSSFQLAAIAVIMGAPLAAQKLDVVVELAPESFHATDQESGAGEG